jgi:hypothetical protein
MFRGRFSCDRHVSVFLVARRRVITSDSTALFGDDFNIGNTDSRDITGDACYADDAAVLPQE